MINRNFGTWRGLIRHGLAQGAYVSRVERYKENIDWSKVRRIVFVCQGNICRSAFADVYARSIGLPSASCGLATSDGQAAYAGANTAAREYGISLDDHKTSTWEHFKFVDGDLLLAMEGRQIRRMKRQLPKVSVQLGLLGEFSRPISPHLHDPHTLSHAYFLSCFRRIISAIKVIERKIQV
jgi:protein-tyrosine phosphatase